MNRLANDPSERAGEGGAPVHAASGATAVTQATAAAALSTDLRVG